MTVRTGVCVKVNSREEFQRQFDVSDAEIIQSMRDEQQQQLVEMDNELREAEQRELIEDPLNVMDETLDRAFELIGVREIILTVLEERKSEYVYVPQMDVGHCIIKTESDTATSTEAPVGVSPS